MTAEAWRCLREAKEAYDNSNQNLRYVRGSNYSAATLTELRLQWLLEYAVGKGWFITGVGIEVLENQLTTNGSK